MSDLISTIDDEALLHAVNGELNRCQELAFFDVYATVASGIVCLTGEVSTAHARETAGAAALHVPGVRAVINAIIVPVTSATPAG